MSNVLNEKNLAEEALGMHQVPSGPEMLSMGPKYVPIALCEDNFQPIEQASSNSKIAFVDGGSSIIFESAGMCIGYIRVARILYAGTKRLSRERSGFYVLVSESDGRYVVKTFPQTQFNDTVFDPDDESLRSGLDRCEPSRVIGIVRRLAEIRLAQMPRSEADFVLLDGTLEVRYPYEREMLNRALCEGNLAALSKTCSLTTSSGRGITRILYHMASSSSSFRDSMWFYNPIVTNNNPMHEAEVYFIQLHERSRYVFRFETCRAIDAKRAIELFSLLSSLSSDPVFLGYPYGFIDVDQYARISIEESQMMAASISVMMGSGWNKFKRELDSMNAHSILDKIRF